MAWRMAAGRKWNRLRDTVKREFLREPDRVLIDRGPDGVPLQSEKAAVLDGR